MCIAGVGDAVHPDEIEARLTRRQILEWVAVYRIRPFGEKRADLRSAVQTFWLMQFGEEVPDDHSPEKYMLKFDDTEPTEAERLMEEIRESL
jgi:hypothetical protein